MAKTTEPKTADTGADTDAPPTLILEIKTASGETWGQIIAESKEFKTGSRGYYANGKEYTMI